MTAQRGTTPHTVSYWDSYGYPQRVIGTMRWLAERKAWSVHTPTGIVVVPSAAISKIGGA